jgi:hypothetical protein
MVNVGVSKFDNEPDRIFRGAPYSEFSGKTGAGKRGHFESGYQLTGWNVHKNTGRIFQHPVPKVNRFAI